jgi:hypothetical protein
VRKLRINPRRAENAAANPSCADRRAWLALALLGTGGLAGAALAAGGTDGDVRGVLSMRRVDAIQAGVATATTLLLLLGIVLRTLQAGGAARRVHDGLLMLLGLAGAACWWNLGLFHYDHYLHRSDQYLYFTGAKYFDELGYDGLYRCTAVADADAGLEAQVSKRKMRDLAVNELVRGSTALADPSVCTDRFSDARWVAFQRDVAWFRNHMSPRQWRLTQTDHGYNATPAWGVLAISLANTGPATDARVLALALLDPLLLAVMWGAVLWAFGWRIACVGLVFWGTSYLTRFGWTGGAFLRQDWLAASVVSLALLRRRHPAASGFLLSCAAMIRIFPVLIASGLVLKAALSMLRRRSWRPEPDHLRFAGGAIAAALLVLPLSVAIAGAGGWPGFVSNSQVHLDTPLQNYMGLKTALSYDHSRRANVAKDASLADPFAAWKQGRRDAFEGRRLLFVALVAGYLALLAWAVREREDWEAAVLGIGMIPIAVELTGYYYAVLLGFAFLGTRTPIIGAALCGLAALGWWIASHFLHYDEIFTWSSLSVLAFVVFATLMTGRRTSSGDAGGGRWLSC